MVSPFYQRLTLFSDFQLSFLLHLYFVVSSGGFVVKVRPNSLNFVLSLDNVYNELAVIFNELHFKPSYSVFVGEGDNLDKYRSTTDSFYKYEDGSGFFATTEVNGQKRIMSTKECSSDYFSCMNAAIYGYKKSDWGIVLTFDEETSNKLSPFLRDFFRDLSDKYLEVFTFRNDKFYERERNRLALHCKGKVGALDLDFKENTDSQGLLRILVCEWINNAAILDVSPQQTFPYQIKFKISLQETKKTAKISIKIKGKKVFMDGVEVFDDGKKLGTRYVAIMKYILAHKEESIETASLAEEVEGRDLTSKEYKNYKDRVIRMSDRIEKAIGVKIFSEIGEEYIILDKQLDIISE